MTIGPPFVANESLDGFPLSISDCGGGRRYLGRSIQYSPENVTSNGRVRVVGLSALKRELPFVPAPGLRFGAMRTAFFSSSRKRITPGKLSSAMGLVAPSPSNVAPPPPPRFGIVTPT